MVSLVDFFFVLLGFPSVIPIIRYDMGLGLEKYCTCIHDDFISLNDKMMMVQVQ